MKLDITRLKFTVATGELCHLDDSWNTDRFFPASRITSHNRLYLPLNGHGTVTDMDRGQVFELRRGRLLLIPSYANVRVACEQHLTKYWVHFDVQLDGTDVNLLLFANQCDCLDVTADLSHYIWLFQRLIRHYQPPYQPMSPMIHYESQALLATLLTPFLQDNLLDRPHKGFPKLFELLYYIEQHISRKITLQELASVSCLHPNYLSSLFKRQMKRSLFEYINRQRIAHAVPLLQSGELTISEVANRVGISTSQAFNKMFKRYFQSNLSPSTYAQSIREAHSENTANRKRQAPITET